MCPRTVKYFNENIRKQEFGLSKTSTSPSEHIPSKTKLSLSPCVHRVPICKRPAAGATKPEDREIFLRKHESEDCEIFLGKIFENKSLAYRKPNYILQKHVSEDCEKPHSVSIEFFNSQKFCRATQLQYINSASCSSERIPSKTELSLSPSVHRVPIYKQPAAGATQSEDREIFYGRRI